MEDQVDIRYVDLIPELGITPEMVDAGIDIAAKFGADLDGMVVRYIYVWMTKTRNEQILAGRYPTEDLDDVDPPKLFVCPPAIP